MNKNKLPIYQAKVSLTDDTGIFAISFVDYPANESNFLALKKATEVKLNLNETKQILTGAVLIPEQLIYRNDVTRGEYYIKFSARDIEQIALKMMKTGVALNNTTHQHETGLKGNYLVELWIVQDSKRDKSVALGLGEYPKGTLMASYKVADANYWKKEVLTGNVKGFSLEGYFNFNNINMNKNRKPAAKTLPAKKGNPIAALLRSVAVALEGDSTAAAEGIVEEAAKDETDSGEPVMIFELADGGEIWVDETGFCTIEGEQAPAGDHALKDGNVIVIDDSGNLVVTQEEGESTDPAAPEVDATTLAAAKAMGAAFLKTQGKAATKPGNNAAQIAKLQAEIEKLKKSPSTKPAKAKVEASSQDKPESFTAGVANVLSARLARKNGQ